MVHLFPLDEIKQDSIGGLVLMQIEDGGTFDLVDADHLRTTRTGFELIGARCIKEEADQAWPAKDMATLCDFSALVVRRKWTSTLSESIMAAIVTQRSGSRGKWDLCAFFLIRVQF